MSAATETSELEEAVARLWAEFDQMTTRLMIVVDLLDGAQQAGKRIDFPALRRALGEQVREAIRARDAVLAPFGITAEEAATDLGDERDEA